MININKHTKLAQQTWLAQQYKQTKKIEKAMGVALQNLSQKYQLALESSTRLTESVVAIIKCRQSTIFSDLQRQKDEIVQKIDQKWDSFKKYAISVRRAFLGQDSSSTFQNCSITEIQSVVDMIERKIQIFDKITEDYEKICHQITDILWSSKNQNNSQISKSQKYKTLILQDYISPIKSKRREDLIENTQIDDNFEQRMRQVNDTTQNKQKTIETTPTSQNELKTQISHKDKFKKNNLRDNHQIIYPQSQKKKEKQQINRQSKQLTNTKRTIVCKLGMLREQHISIESSMNSNNQGLKSIKSLKNLRSLRQSMSNNKLIQFESSVNSSSKRISQVNSPQKNELSQRKSYNGCLQMLHNQKLQFERVRRKFK